MHADDCSSSRLSAARASAKAVLSLIRLARALTDSGERIDLHGLDDQVGRLCARILDLPPRDGQLMRDDLTALARETEALRATLRSQTDASG